MGNGASAKAAQERTEAVALKRQQVELQKSELVVTKERHRSEKASEAYAHELVTRELSAAKAEHGLRLHVQREELQAEHREAFRESLEAHDKRSELALASTSEAEHGELVEEALREAAARRAEEFAREEAQHSELVGEQRSRLARAHEAHGAAHREVLAETRKRDEESRACALAQEELAASRRGAQHGDEAKLAEARTYRSEAEALVDSQRGLEERSRTLQQELGRVAYAVGQKDHELQVKDAELREVRGALADIQRGMDEVNAQLKAQCDRVRRAEATLRPSQDTGGRAKAMREMLCESHGALAQLCGLLEKERAAKERCNQGLRQQRVRTELLLQLLHHLKGRTQDLAPHALLGRQAALDAALASGVALSASPTAASAPPLSPAPAGAAATGPTHEALSAAHPADGGGGGGLVMASSHPATPCASRGEGGAPALATMPSAMLGGLFGMPGTSVGGLAPPQPFRTEPLRAQLPKPAAGLVGPLLSGGSSVGASSAPGVAPNGAASISGGAAVGSLSRGSANGHAAGCGHAVGCGHAPAAGAGALSTGCGIGAAVSGGGGCGLGAAVSGLGPPLGGGGACGLGTSAGNGGSLGVAVSGGSLGVPVGGASGVPQMPSRSFGAGCGCGGLLGPPPAPAPVGGTLAGPGIGAAPPSAWGPSGMQRF
eukprot:TRINITY_DN23408_c0_g3_i1.p1 TRINITY_DN23408_c0_g3~~TRINITY_DN23408_c0_g3_i1.p1  ORF type:complete len:713 (-),score=167.40 TRINITY_DN23408_c0_g3_i1:30-2018(-)